MPEKLLRISLICNQRCLFCNTLNKKEPIENINSIRNSLKVLRKSPKAKILITGGEPTLHPGLCKLVNIYKKFLNPRAIIGIQTNALRCSDDKFTHQLIKAGINYAFVPFHHFNEKIFNQITQNKTSYKKVIKGIKNLSKHGSVICINIVINSYNYKDLTKIVKFLEKNFNFATISFAYVQPHGLAEKNYDIVPPYSKARNAIKAAYNYCIKKNIFFLNPNCGLPLCLVKGFEQYSQDYQESAANNRMSTDPNKVKPPKCLTCRKNNRCSGIWKKYVDMYGYQELDPY